MRALPVLFLAALLPLAAACGGADTTQPGATADAASPPASAGTDELDQPQAIISLSATATEMLFAVDAGEQVIAVDDASDYPEGVPTTDLSGYEPNLEAILGYGPDLVLVSDDTDPNDLVTGLESAGVPVLQLPAAKTLDDTYAQLEQIGAATGHVAEAAAVVKDMRGDVEAIVADLPERAEPLTYYHELDPTYYSVTDGTFIGAVYTALGLTSIADEAEGELYPQLSPEYIVSADPDVIFLADTTCCEVTPEQVAAREGWGGMSAVTGGRIYPVDEDIASRWGPRVVDFMAAVAEQVTQLQPAG